MTAFGLFDKMKQKQNSEKKESKRRLKKKVIFQLRQCPSTYMVVRHKPKNSLKTPKMHFLPVFELMSDSLTTI